MGDWFIGEIRNFAFSGANQIPKGWVPCDGSTLPVSQNQALFSLIGNTYGGSYPTTFAVPDLRGRVMVSRNPGSAGTNTNLQTYQEGKPGGMEDVTLTLAELPAHNHGLACQTAPGTIGPPSGNTVSSAGTNAGVPTVQPLYNAPVATASMVPLNPGSVSSTGGGAAHSNMQPYLVTNFYIATNGYYPPRN